MASALLETTGKEPNKVLDFVVDCKIISALTSTDPAGEEVRAFPYLSYKRTTHVPRVTDVAFVIEMSFVVLPTTAPGLTTAVKLLTVAAVAPAGVTETVTGVVPAVVKVYETL